MFASLNTDLVSITASLADAIRLAARHKFGGVDCSASQLLATEFDLSSLRTAMNEGGLRPGYLSIPPGKLPSTPEDFEVAIALLPEIAKRASALGFTRAGIVILPFHESLGFDQAFEEHVVRLNRLVAVLDEYGIALGLEYVSPLTRRSPYPNHFVHNLSGMLSLCSAVASPRCGLMLDSFHWHCAGETQADLEGLRNEQIVVVHINDAPLIPVEEQTVGNRSFPGETGGIDLTSFVGSLKRVGYDGPVTCEPMAGAIHALPSQTPDFIAARTSQSLAKVLN